MNSGVSTFVSTMGAAGPCRWRQWIANVLTLFLACGVTLPAMAQSSPKLTPAQTKAQEDWAYSLALQAATWGAPIVTMYALRNNDATGANVKAAPNSLWRMEDITTPEMAVKEGYVAPNCSMIYGFGFLDLRQEPVVMTLPNSEGRYYMVETLDMWTNAFAYPAGVRAGYKGGKVAYVGPNWKGTLPAGLKRIDAPTPWILIQPRVHMGNPSEVEAARKVLGGITLQTLSQYLGKPSSAAAKYDYPTPNFVNPLLPVSVLDFKEPLQFWEILAAAMNENPPPKTEIEGLLPMFAPLGLEFGKPWDRSKVDPITLQQMTRAAQDIPKILEDMPFGRLTNGWFIPPPTIGDPKMDYRIRAIIARIGLTANVPQEAVYYALATDADGNVPTGAKNYTMTFKPPPPYIKPGLWQLRMFDGESHYPIENPIKRYVIGSDIKELKYEADGSVIIYIQADSPGKDKESNWLPAPKGPMFIVLAEYPPGEAVVKSLSDPNAYVPPAAVPVQQAQR